VVTRLRDRVPPGVELVLTDGEPTRLIEAWAGATRTASSHGFGLDDAIWLALTLDHMPRRLIVHAIEAAADLTQGTGLTPLVAAA
jgi:hydrogenase maturation protease